MLAPPTVSLVGHSSDGRTVRSGAALWGRAFQAGPLSTVHQAHIPGTWCIEKELLLPSLLIGDGALIVALGCSAGMMLMFRDDEDVGREEVYKRVGPFDTHKNGPNLKTMPISQCW